MPIKSYIAIAADKQKDALRASLEEVPECEVIPSENEDVLIIVSETDDEDQEARLLQRLNGLKSLRHLTLVSAFKD